jgi:pyrroloquinoline quinone biosynthesis protein B
VQDGGLPHAACSCVRCEAARKDPSRKRHVASLALIASDPPSVFLIDATPDLRDQLHAIRDLRSRPAGRTDRKPVDGLLLTHAHIGHYLGLAFFGFEAVSTKDLPVYASPRMAAFLRDNGPWSQLVRLENVSIREIRSGEAFDLPGGIRVTPLQVPHRDEYTDTLGFVVRGERSRVLYVPDTDSWRAWPTSIVDVVRDVDVALLDGTFYSAGELPGRDVTKIGHPLVLETMDLLEPLVKSGKRVFFTHLNHSNPALDPASPERKAMEARGFRVLEEGQEIPL